MFLLKFLLLKERKGGYIYISELFIKKFNQEYGRNIEGIKEDAIKALTEYNWPGNVRELENIIGRAIINMRINEKIIQKKHMPKFGSFAQSEELQLDNDILELESMTLEELTQKVEKDYISRVLRQCYNNKTKTAKALGISLRNLYYKIEKYGIE